jgi:hypothetical protein
MIAHGAHSMLGIISDADARCYALGNPGDPAVPPQAQHFSRFCPTTANGSNASSDPYGSWNYTSLNHTQGYAGMVVPLTEFLVAAAAAVEKKGREAH